MVSIVSLIGTIIVHLIVLDNRRGNVGTFFLLFVLILEFGLSMIMFAFIMTTLFSKVFQSKNIKTYVQCNMIKPWKRRDKRCLFFNQKRASQQVWSFLFWQCTEVRFASFLSGGFTLLELSHCQKPVLLHKWPLLQVH